MKLKIKGQDTTHYFKKVKKVKRDMSINKLTR
jgi:hypothetical protein